MPLCMLVLDITARVLLNLNSHHFCSKTSKVKSSQNSRDVMNLVELWFELSSDMSGGKMVKC